MYADITSILLEVILVRRNTTKVLTIILAGQLQRLKQMLGPYFLGRADIGVEFEYKCLI